MTVRRGLAIVAAAALSSLPAAVDLQGEAGVSRTRRDDGMDVSLFSLQPGLLLRSERSWSPLLGLRAGPALIVDADNRDYAAGGEVHMLGGLAWQTEPLRADIVASWGVGRWRDHGLLGGNGWGQAISIAGCLTWRIDERARIGPALGWSRRLFAETEIDDRRIALALIYRLD